MYSMIGGRGGNGDRMLRKCYDTLLYFTWPKL